MKPEAFFALLAAVYLAPHLSKLQGNLFATAYLGIAAYLMFFA